MRPASTEPAAGIDWLGLSGRRVLVAGAGGIGAACAAAFTAAGARVAVADVDTDRLAALGSVDSMDTVTTVHADLATPEGCEAAVDQVLDAFAGLDVLVHAVGVNHRVPVLDVDDATWRRILDV